MHISQYSKAASRTGGWAPPGITCWPVSTSPSTQIPPRSEQALCSTYNLQVCDFTNMLSDFQPLPSRTLKEKYLVGAEKYLVSAKLIAYLKWLMNVAAFKDCGNVDHLHNKQVAFLNHPNNQLWRELLYTALDAWYSKFSGKPSKKQKGRFSCGTWVDFFTNIDDFFDPLADDDEPHPAGVALDVAGTRSCQAASPLPQRQGLRRPPQCRRRTRLKIKAPASDLGWLCIAAERARGEARIQHSRRAGAQHGRVQCTVL